MIIMADSSCLAAPCHVLTPDCCRRLQHALHELDAARAAAKQSKGSRSREEELRSRQVQEPCPACIAAHAHAGVELACRVPVQSICETSHAYANQLPMLAVHRAAAQPSPCTLCRLSQAEAAHQQAAACLAELAAERSRSAGTSSRPSKLSEIPS